MASIDLFWEERRIVEDVLTLLEAAVARLNTGEAFPNVVLGDMIDFFREVESAAGETGSTLLLDMLWALESLDRGEAGAAGAFVIASRKYISLWRDRIAKTTLTDHGRQERCQPPLPLRYSLRDAPASSLIRRFERLVERYRRLS